MTGSQMMIFSNVFLGMMIFFFGSAIVVYFMLDVRKAWKIVAGKKLPIQRSEQEIGERLTQKISTTDLLKKDMLEKSIAMQLDNATTLLISQQGNGNTDYMVMDITYIHTEVVL